MKFSEEKLIEAAKRNGLKLEKSDKPGFHINGQWVTSGEAFNIIFAGWFDNIEEKSNDEDV